MSNAAEVSFNSVAKLTEANLLQIIFNWRQRKKSEPDDDFKGTNLWNLYWNNFTDILQI